VVAWRLETVKCEQCCWWCTRCDRLYHFEERCIGRTSGGARRGQEELPRGGVLELTPIVTLDTLDLAVELSTDKRKELGDS
jgi:hypothetical protein